jgi:Zinc knuckle
VAQQGNNNSKNKKVSCWNCGGNGHSLKECTKPFNQTLIKQQKKAFREAKKGKRKKGDGKNNKWAPPKSEEKNCRVINNKPIY